MSSISDDASSVMAQNHLGDSPLHTVASNASDIDNVCCCIELYFSLPPFTDDRDESDALRDKCKLLKNKAGYIAYDLATNKRVMDLLRPNCIESFEEYCEFKKVEVVDECKILLSKLEVKKLIAWWRHFEDLPKPEMWEL